MTTLSSRFRAGTILLATFLGASVFIARADKGNPNQPSWFPEVSCKEAWSNQELDRFDFNQDTSNKRESGRYEAYQARLSQTLPVARSSCYKDWTVLVYMAADTDLEPYALWDLDEMEGGFKGGNFAASTLKSDLLVQHDTATSKVARRLHMFQAPGDYSPLDKPGYEKADISRVKSPVISTIDKSKNPSDSDHGKRLKDFLHWGMKTYPSKHYFVVIWSHGQGWADDQLEKPTVESRFVTNKDLPINFEDWAKPNTTGDIGLPKSSRFGGFVFSKTANDYLGVPELSRIFREIKEETLEGLKNIDMYAADSCLMQMVEVAYQLADTVRFVAGSAQVHSYLGLPYRELMYEINSGGFLGQLKKMQTSDEPYLVARMLPELYSRSLDPVHGSQGQGDPEAIETYTMASLSAPDLRTRLVPAIRNLGVSLKNYILEDSFRAVDLQFIIGSTPSFMGGSRDLGSFIGLIKLQLKKEAESQNGTMTPHAQELLDSCNNAQDALQLVSLDYSFGTSYQEIAKPLHVLGFRALSIWLPASPVEFENRLGDFDKSLFFGHGDGFADANDWEEWLHLIYPKNQT